MPIGQPSRYGGLSQQLACRAWQAPWMQAWKLAWKSACSGRWRCGAAARRSPCRPRASCARCSPTWRSHRGRLSRDALCEFLWDLPSDPRAELRGSLSKLRGLLDEPGRTRVQAEGDAIRLDLADVSVDVLELDRAAARRPGDAGCAWRCARWPRASRASSCRAWRSPRSAPYSAWLVGQRRRLRALHAAVLEHLAAALPPAGDEALACLALVAAARPLRPARARAPARRAGRTRRAARRRRAPRRDGRLFEAEGQDAGPLAHAWRARQAAPCRATVWRTPASAVARPEPPPAATRRASIAVMPFADASAGRRPPAAWAAPSRTT